MTTRGILLRELEWIAGNCGRILALARSADLDFRPEGATGAPAGNLRTLRQLGHHLSQIPAVDLAVMRGLTEPEVVAEEQRLTAAADSAGLPAGWGEALRGGL